ncbi:MFS transporter [Streptomyces asiaticus]
MRSFSGATAPSVAARRGYCVAWAFTGAYLAVPVVGFLGLVLVDGAPLGVAGWRWMFAIGSLGALLTFLVRRGLPESPRWLESVGRMAEADAVTSRFEKAAEAEGWTPPAISDEPERPDAGSPVEPPLGGRDHRFGFLLHRGGQCHVKFGPYVPVGAVPHECAHHRHRLAVLTESALDGGSPLLPGPAPGRLRSGGRLHRCRRGAPCRGNVSRRAHTPCRVRIPRHS